MKKLNSISVSDNIFVYGISSIPFFLILGPAIPDIIISLLVLYFLVTKIKFVIEAIKKYYYPFLIWSLYLVFNSLISDNIVFSLSSSLPYIRFSFLLILIYYLLESNPAFINLSSFTILRISLILSIFISSSLVPKAIFLIIVSSKRFIF